jgi:hypothetical protein
MEELYPILLSVFCVGLIAKKASHDTASLSKYEVGGRVVFRLHVD